jgi:hypothetical protein
LCDPLAISLAESLLEESGIPFFVMDQNTMARQAGGTFASWLDIRVPREREAETREIPRSVEQMNQAAPPAPS